MVNRGGSQHTIEWEGIGYSRLVDVIREDRVQVSEGGEESSHRARKVVTDQCENENAMGDTRKSGVRLGKIQRQVGRNLLGFLVRIWRVVKVPLPHRFVP